LNFKACALEIVGVITYFETLHKYTKKNTKYKIHKKKSWKNKNKIYISEKNMKNDHKVFKYWLRKIKIHKIEYFDSIFLTNKDFVGKENSISRETKSKLDV
jgi:hypothetical protein